MTSSIGDVIAANTRCTLLDSDGQPCGEPGMPGIPLGCCESHALMITRAVMRLGGIEVREETR